MYPVAGLMTRAWVLSCFPMHMLARVTSAGMLILAPCLERLSEDIQSNACSTRLTMAASD